VTSVPRSGADAARALGRLRSMLLVRRFEERCAEHYSAGKIRGFLHLYDGQEAIATGALAASSDDDTIVATYREHAHALLRGMPARVLFAELFGKATGCCRGRGGSMHLFDLERRLFGGNAIVAGGLPLAVGLALADRLARRPRVTLCFFGDGATDEGEFHESLNLAALWSLPVLFLCENNHYAMGTSLERHEADVALTRRPRAFGIPSERIDGMDVIAVERAVGYAAECVRDGGGPRFLELEAYRFRAHSMYDAERYRSKEEVASWRARCPIERYARTLREEGRLDDAGLASLEASIARELDEAVASAASDDVEDVSLLERDVVAPANVAAPAPERTE
jgi:pyruvate dehydrogenase E1 component alpha subunit